MTTWSYAEKRRQALAEAHQLRNETRASAEPTPPSDPPPRPLLLYVTCPRCGATVDIQARGEPLDDGRELRNVLRCTAGCRPEVIALKAGFLKADDWQAAAEARRAS